MTARIRELDRVSVQLFSIEMRKKLQDNEHKGDFRKTCTVEYLLHRLDDEVQELKAAIARGDTREDALSECADVANFAMMISEVYNEP